MIGKVGQDIYLPVGDTGVLRVNINGSYMTTEDDRVLFTVKKGNQPVIVRVVTPIANSALIEFTNAMTKHLDPGDYRYDVRLVRDAVLEDGIPVGGEGVDTPLKKGVFKLLEVVGEV